MGGMLAVTGANGFVGHYLTASLSGRKDGLVAITRSQASVVTFRSSGRVVPDLSACSHNTFSACSAVIHCAGRAHRMGEDRAQALPAYRSVNVEGTRGVVQAMIAAGVRRIVYLSSIKACGERSTTHPLAPDDVPTPEDAYGISKLEAEQLLLEYGRQGVIDPIIIRPVLVHGPGAKGNLARLCEAVRNGRWLPLGAVRNKRSFLGVDNLCDAIITAATLPWERFGDFGAASEKRTDLTANTEIGAPGGMTRAEGGISDSKELPRARLVPGAPGRVYHLADEGVISTRRLVEVLAEGMGVKPRLVSVPRWLAVGGATLLGKAATARRLFDDLEVDASAFSKDTGWQPTKSLEDGLREMAVEYARRMRDSGKQAGSDQGA